MRRLVKMEDKLQKPHFKNSNLLIGQELWQAYCQTLLVILIKEFIKLFHKKYFFEVDVQYLHKLHELLYDLPPLPEKMKIQKFKNL